MKEIISKIKQLEERKKKIPEKYKDEQNIIEENILRLKGKVVEIAKDKE